MTPNGKARIAAAAILAMLALVGCRAEEQGRATEYQQGVYRGKKDQSIDKATRESLRNRAQNQKFGL